MCTGCGACAQICSKNAVSMAYDDDGFLYPEIDSTLCNKCNACIQICHMQNKVNAKQTPLQVYAACLPNEEELEQVSSGGVFWALAQHFIDSGGVVYGVEQPSLFDVHHARAEMLEQCKPFRRSKYLESHIGVTYINVKTDLKTGRMVLFTGTGCQVAGLYGFLGKKEYANLITCEMVCHGVPSMKVFQTYIHELEHMRDKKVQRIIYRDKSKGWNKNCIRICFSDGTSEVGLSSETPIHRGYLSGYYYRPSCSQCRYAQLPRVADITLADYWKYQGVLLGTNRNKGISLVVCSSCSGVKCMEDVKHKLMVDVTELENAIKSCTHLTTSPVDSKYRKAFFSNMKSKGFYAAYNKCRRKENVRGFIAGIGRYVLKKLNIS